MNRQERRRLEREGGRQQRSWDVIIAALVLSAIVVIFACIYFFPNLDLDNYQQASPRVLEMIVNRGVKQLEADWPNINGFSYGYYQSEKEWPSFVVAKTADKWQFTATGETKATEYSTSALPAYYRDLSQVLTNLKGALNNRDFKLAYQQTNQGKNDVSLIRVVDADKGLQEQYVLSFNAEHQLNAIIYYNSTATPIIGSSYDGLYPAATTPSNP